MAGLLRRQQSYLLLRLRRPNLTGSSFLFFVSSSPRYVNKKKKTKSCLVFDTYASLLRFLLLFLNSLGAVAFPLPLLASSVHFSLRSFVRSGSSSLSKQPNDDKSGSPTDTDPDIVRPTKAKNKKQNLCSMSVSKHLRCFSSLREPPISIFMVTPAPRHVCDVPDDHPTTLVLPSNERNARRRLISYRILSYLIAYRIVLFFHSSKKGLQGASGSAKKW